MRQIKNTVPPISEADVKAILLALPLVKLGYCDDSAQILPNETSVKGAALKLTNRIPQLAAEEIRVIYLAIAFAIAFLSGDSSDILDVSGIDPQWRSDLSRNFFTYNRLLPHFDKLLTDIESRY